ncbi:MAG: hypothetical protein HY698_07015 [Deltaproteobacteria bacterium]|nr:hypothetical protein [Deltaproteobacteria bacterium]
MIPYDELCESLTRWRLKNGMDGRVSTRVSRIVPLPGVVALPTGLGPGLTESGSLTVADDAVEEVSDAGDATVVRDSFSGTAPSEATGEIDVGSMDVVEEDLPR